jgi:hypothetical protein
MKLRVTQAEELSPGKVIFLTCALSQGAGNQEVVRDILEEYVRVHFSL